MASVNKVILVGNLGRDPEMRTFPSGDQVANITLATTDRWRDKNTGENKESTEWHRVVFHARLAEIVGQYCRKGSQVYIEGSLHTRKWTDQQGIERYSTEVRADSMQMLNTRREAPEGGAYAPPAQRQPAPQPGQQQAPRRGPPPEGYAGTAPSNTGRAPRQGGGSGFDDMDDDIPFAAPLRLSSRLHYAI